MGGEGSLMSANNSLKNNRSLLSKRKEKKALSGSYSNLKMKDFPEATPQKLRQIKDKISEENKQTTQKQLVFLIAFLLILYLIYVYLI